MSYSKAVEITLPSVKLDLDQLVNVVRALDASARRRIAQALAESEMDARLSALIHQLAARSSKDEIGDDEIDQEIREARLARSGC